MARQRKKKSESPNPGLTPDSLREQIERELSDGETVSSVRKPNTKKDRTFLPKARKGKTRAAGGGGIFGADDVHDIERGAKSEQEAVSDAERAGGHLNTEDSITELLRQIVYGNDTFPEVDAPPIVLILRKVVLKAQSGEQNAIDFVTNRIEGKAGQAAKKTSLLGDVEKAISQVELAALNRFVDTDPSQELSDNE